MKRFLSIFFSIALLNGSFCCIFLPINISAQTSVATIAQKPNEPLVFGLQDGTPVKLRTGRNLSSATEKTGETVDFEVLEDVKVGDVVVIPRGGIALGTVTRGKPKGRMGKGRQTRYKY